MRGNTCSYVAIGDVITCVDAIMTRCNYTVFHMLEALAYRWQEAFQPITKDLACSQLK